MVNGLDRDLLLAHFGLSAPLSGDLPEGSGMSPTPEPGTLALLAAGLIGLLVCGLKKRR